MRLIDILSSILNEAKTVNYIGPTFFLRFQEYYRRSDEYNNNIKAVIALRGDHPEDKKEYVQKKLNEKIDKLAKDMAKHLMEKIHEKLFFNEPMPSFKYVYTPDPYWYNTPYSLGKVSVYDKDKKTEYSSIKILNRPKTSGRKESFYIDPEKTVIKYKEIGKAGNIITIWNPSDKGTEYRQYQPSSAKQQYKKKRYGQGDYEVDKSRVDKSIKRVYTMFRKQKEPKEVDADILIQFIRSGKNFNYYLDTYTKPRTKATPNSRSELESTLENLILGLRNEVIKNKLIPEDEIEEAEENVEFIGSPVDDMQKAKITFGPITVETEANTKTYNIDLEKTRVYIKGEKVQ